LDLVLDEATQMQNDGFVSLCCQGIVFVTSVTKMWVNGFGARSMVAEELVTLSRNGAAKKVWFFYGGGEGRHAILI